MQIYLSNLIKDALVKKKIEIFKVNQTKTPKILADVLLLIIVTPVCKIQYTRLYRLHITDKLTST